MSTPTGAAISQPVSPSSAPGGPAPDILRRLLAVVAPVPMLAMGTSYLVSPFSGDAPLPEQVAAATQDPGRIHLMEWLTVPFMFLLLPAIAAVIWVAYSGAPRLTTAAAVVAGGGLLFGLTNLPGPVLEAALIVEERIPVDPVVELETAVEEHPIMLLAGLSFIIGITFGLLLLGLALWRSHAAPAWAGWALALGGFTHPFMPGPVVAGIGLWVAALGFAGAGVALWRRDRSR
ncbi:hypothetical protein [Micropruina sonneratiae]|uniref:hypothetical protein n=1 Tax=Micropruina sonneratiae TaxID=2986940 RepID=UPI002227C79A|nr:hypothetical protein [Micropruina sp. KQZ13P-5]MCW3158257.1 hypothetical protein [Micropruina sp. KQZ13P-5]